MEQLANIVIWVLSIFGAVSMAFFVLLGVLALWKHIS